MNTNTAPLAPATPAQAAVEAASPAAVKVCPNCGNSFSAGGRGMGKRFCDSSCRTAFNNRAKAEGAVMAALVKCWVQNRHAKPGTREAELCRQSRSELTEMTRMFLDADKDAGRPPVADYVEQLLEDTLYVDRCRKF